MVGVISWACRTPRRLIAVLAVPVLLIVVGASLWSGQRGSSRNSGDTGAASAAANAQVPDATPFVTAAVRFVNVWGRLAPGQSPSQWHDAVRPLATPDLGAKLAHTDPSSLEGATASGQPEVRFVTTTSALIAIPMTNGNTVVVTVVTGQSKDWLVDDVEPDVGN